MSVFKYKYIDEILDNTSGKFSTYSLTCFPWPAPSILRPQSEGLTAAHQLKKKQCYGYGYGYFGRNRIRFRLNFSEILARQSEGLKAAHQLKKQGCESGYFGLSILVRYDQEALTHLIW